MKKQYDKSKCKLLAKDKNVEEIVARNKSVLIHAVYEDDKVSGNLYDKLDDKLLTILRDDFGYECEIQNFGGSFFGSYYLVIYL